MISTHTHHRFGEDIPCDLPDTYEAHYGPRGRVVPEVKHDCGPFGIWVRRPKVTGKLVCLFCGR